MTSRTYEIKKKIILNNDSKIFKNWNDFTGITQNDFLEGVKWLCEEEKDKNGKPVRTIGCSKDGKIVKLRRIYDRYGEFEGFFLYEGTQDGYYERYRDHVMLDPWDRV